LRHGTKPGTSTSGKRGTVSLVYQRRGLKGQRPAAKERIQDRYAQLQKASINLPFGIGGAEWESNPSPNSKCWKALENEVFDIRRRHS
jgi:hypothetical protein